MWTRLLDAALKRLIQKGTLRLTLPDDSVLAFGDGTNPAISVKVHNRATIRRLTVNPELALGEAYTDGALTIANDDLSGLLAMLLGNRRIGSFNLATRLVNRARRVFRRLQMSNPAGRSQKNVAYHYDLSSELYELFLDEDRQYSCAYFRHPDDTLEEAQANKKHHLAAKLLLKPGMRVLDIGCGWGGMAITLARDYGVQVVGVTLSKEQHAVAVQMVREAGLSNQIDIRLQDYREVMENFDRIVSVGMFEHVGVPRYDEYFRHVKRMLTSDGIALIHTIGRAGPPYAANPWINKYIFPGGYAPALSEVIPSIDATELVVCDVESLRLHYAETLRMWDERFIGNIERARNLYDGRFCRMWRYYLNSMERSFREGRMLVYQIQLAKKNDVIPITREYLYSSHLGDYQYQIVAD